jgi:7,8-dihydro-6-hydroxymethylpterin-pyrophosphokinase
MDIDILFFNNQIVNLVDLQIPHPEIANRLFVLKPLSDIAPEYIHPVLNTTISALLEICKDKCKIEKFEF